jgi:DNA primase
MSSEQIQQIKERLDIVEVVGEYVKLTKAGKNYKGLSPFRSEKTPSFYVSPDKGMYYDFSSGQGGDMFTFVQTMEGLDFAGALRTLAEKAGVTLTQEPKGARDARERMYGALEDACAFYETKLAEQQDAQAYLTDRGLEPATMRTFRLGFAPDGWQSARDYLEGKGYRISELEQAGLVKKGDKGSHYDRFRSRIMFPIMDPAGRVIAFSGRIFGDASKDPETAKYLNSPETPLFEKGKVLYGYHKAKQYIRTYDCAILVEGQMDIVLSHQAGYVNTVAVSGTGLTEEHLGLIARLSKNIILAFDADSAGVASVERAGMLALARDMQVKVVKIPKGKDPADCIREDKELWKEAVKGAQHIIDFMFDHVLHMHKAKAGTNERDFIVHVREAVLPFVARVRSGTEQAYFVRSLANRLAVTEDAVWHDVRSIQASARTHVGPEPQKEMHKDTIRTTPDAQHKHAQTQREHLERAVAGFLFWRERLDSAELSSLAIQELAQRFEVSLDTILATYSAHKDALAFEAEIQYAETTDKPPEIFALLLMRLAREIWTTERNRVSDELRRAERENDDEKAHALLLRFQDISRCIETLVGKGVV